jgi:putative ABC transport system permease protein
MASDTKHSVQVVGVAHDSVARGRQIREYFYVPLAQNFSSVATLQVRTAAAPEGMISAVQEEIATLAPELPVFDVQTMMQGLYTINGFLRFQLGAGITGALGALGLILAIVGVYGVISFTASQRTHEIGIRMALGAQRTDILKLIFGQGLLIVGIGVVVGLVAASAIARLVGNFLVGVKSTDPLTYASVSIALVTVALLACYVPSHRAMRVDPMQALRHE